MQKEQKLKTKQTKTPQHVESKEGRTKGGGKQSLVERTQVK